MMSSSSSGLIAGARKMKELGKIRISTLWKHVCVPYLPRFFLVPHYLLANSFKKAHPPGHELLWTISRLVRGVLIKIHVSRCLSNICDANLPNNWHLNVCVWGERMFYESNESMSQIWKNKSFGRNNKIKHYFYLFFLICLFVLLVFDRCFVSEI